MWNNKLETRVNVIFLFTRITFEFLDFFKVVFPESLSYGNKIVLVASVCYTEVFY